MFWLLDHSDSVKSPLVAEHPITSQFTTHQVSGEWSLCLFVNTSEWDCSLGIAQMKNGSSVPGFVGISTEVFEPAFFQQPILAALSMTDD